MRSRGILRVLIVDDEKTIANSLCLILNAHGHAAQAVYSPEEALQLTNDFQPDVLISDVIMPCIDGLELARRLRSRFPSLRVLLISGSETSTTILNDAQRRGVEFAFMQKPVHPKLIMDFVDTCRPVI